jgi:hypothetical protein
LAQSPLNRTAWLFVASLNCLFLAPSNLACSDCEVHGDPVLKYNHGKTSEGYYESSGWNDEWVYFPQGRTYQFVHDLGTEKYVVTLYLAFHPRPLENKAGSSESSGNMGTIEIVTPEYFQVRNDTCAEMYIRAVAITNDYAHGGASGASNEGS